MTKWFLLPGMGATSSMYNTLRGEVDFEIEFINWPKYRGKTSFEEVASRIIEENHIVAADIIGGSSLGGMVSIEIAKIVQSKAVVLIGSAINTGEIQSLLKLLSPLAYVTPISLVQTLCGKHKHIVSQMFYESDPEFIRAMCLYLTSWRGNQGELNKIYRLHGKKDHVIPHPSSHCEVINNAGHLLVLTHPKETGLFLNKTNLHLTKNST
jgi:pimeloyl-ACP methyl ester carboxylesterase